MNSPLNPKGQNLHNIFEVAVPRQPYYNPVNLWKAVGDVKRKEFIEAIHLGAVSFNGPGRPAAHQRSRQARRDLLFRFARVGNARPAHAATYAEPLPALQRTRRSSAETCNFSATRPRFESCRDRSRTQTARPRFRSGGKRGFSRLAFPAPASAPWSF